MIIRIQAACDENDEDKECCGSENDGGEHGLYREASGGYPLMGRDKGVVDVATDKSGTEEAETKSQEDRHVVVESDV